MSAAGDNGLLSGIASGLNAGLDAYNQAQDRQFRIKQYQDELEIKKLLRDQQERQISMEQTEKGLLPDKMSATGYSFTPEQQKLRQIQQQEAQGKLGLLQAQTKEAAGKGQYYAAQAAPGGKLDLKDLKDDQKNLMHDKDYQKANSGLGEVNKINLQLDEAEKGNPIASNMMPVLIARLSTGGQRLNQQEIMAAGGSKALSSRLEQAIQNAQSGTLTKDNINFIRQMVNASARGDQGLLEDVVNRHATMRASNKNIDPDTAYQQLTGKPRGGLLGGGQPQEATQAPAGFVRMKDPKGNIRDIPADQVEAAKAAGGVPL